MKEGGSLVFPSWDALRAEQREAEPEMLLIVKDEEGNVIRRLNAPAKAGFHRVAWDLRFPPANPVEIETGEADLFDGGPQGPLAAPGKYTVTLARQANGVVTPVGQPQTLQAVPIGMSDLSAQDQEKQLAFQRRTAALQRAVLGATRAVAEARNRLEFIQRAIPQTPKADLKLSEQARNLDIHLQDLQVKLTGDPILSGNNAPTPPAIVDRIQNVVGSHWSISGAATRTWEEDYNIAAAEFAPVLEDIRKTIGVDLKGLEDQLEEPRSAVDPGPVAELAAGVGSSHSVDGKGRLRPPFLRQVQVIEASCPNPTSTVSGLGVGKFALFGVVSC